jgi:hypothetical protein
MERHLMTALVDADIATLAGTMGRQGRGWPYKLPSQHHVVRRETARKEIVNSSWDTHTWSVRQPFLSVAPYNTSKFNGDLKTNHKTTLPELSNNKKEVVHHH